MVDDGSAPALDLPEHRARPTPGSSAPSTRGAARTPATPGALAAWWRRHALARRRHAPPPRRGRGADALAPPGRPRGRAGAQAVRRRRRRGGRTARPRRHPPQSRRGGAGTCSPTGGRASTSGSVEHIGKTEGLTANPTRSYLVHTGASASVRRELYDAAGGMDPLLKLGEDVELGYRLAQQGAVFVPDDDARSWHLGRTNAHAAAGRGQPLQPSLRHRPGAGPAALADEGTLLLGALGAARSSTPAGQTLEAGPALGRRTAHRFLPRRRGGARRTLGSARMTSAAHRWRPGPGAAAGAGGVRRRGTGPVGGGRSPSTAFPAPYRLLLPDRVGPRAGGGGPAGARDVQARPRAGLGAPGDGQVARLERTSAFTRAALVRAADEDLDDAVDAGLGHLVVRRWRGGVHLRRGRGRRGRPGARAPRPGARKPKGAAAPAGTDVAPGPRRGGRSRGAAKADAGGKARSGRCGGGSPALTVRG